MRPSKYSSVEERINARKEQYKKYNKKRTTITTITIEEDNHNNHNNSEIDRLRKEIENITQYYEREIRRLNKILKEYEGDGW